MREMHAAKIIDLSKTVVIALSAIAESQFNNETVTIDGKKVFLFDRFSKYIAALLILVEKPIKIGALRELLMETR